MSEILNESAVAMYEVREALEKIKNERGELSFRAQKTYDHLSQAVRLDAKKSIELEANIKALEVPRLRDQYVKKLVDILPTTEKEVKTILTQFSVTVTNDNCKRIATVIAEFT
jgi:DNA-directed RNA polymerase subunit F